MRLKEGAGKMQFNYSQYYKLLSIGSLLIFCFAIFYVIISMGSFFTNNNIADGYKRFLQVLSSKVIIVVLALYIALPPFKHGIHLFTEKEQDAINDVGTITKITRTYGNNKYSYGDEKNVYASYIYIDDEKYYIMYIGDLSIGDEVEFEYLPKSKVVLSIYHAEEAQ